MWYNMCKYERKRWVVTTNVRWMLSNDCASWHLAKRKYRSALSHIHRNIYTCISFLRLYEWVFICICGCEGGHWRNLAIIPRQQPLKPSFFYHLNAAFFFSCSEVANIWFRSVDLVVCLFAAKQNSNEMNLFSLNTFVCLLIFGNLFRSLHIS